MEQPGAPPRREAAHDANTYTTQWQDLRVRTAAVYVAAVGGLVLVLAILSAFGQRATSVIAFWILAYMSSGYYRYRFRCPRCKKAFFMNGPHFVNYFMGRCVHCGLKKWSNGD
jgi:hypothetical protein